MKKRIIGVMFIFVGLLLLVSGRIFYLQVLHGQGLGSDSKLVQKALNVRSQNLSGEEYYRGEILDRKMLSLTDSGIRPTLVSFPGSIKNVTETCKQLEKIIEISADELVLSIKRNQENYGIRTPVLLKVNLTSEEVKKIKENKLTGIAVIPVKTRYGPGSVARHLVGYVNSISPQQWQKLSRGKKTVETNSFLATAYRITDKIGVAGLEGKYEEALKGSCPENSIVGFADANGRLLEGLGYKIKKNQTDSWRNHLILTIDKRCQEIVERIMNQEIARGAVAVIDIANGDVLALASRPDFDQNKVEKYLAGVDELLDRADRVAFYPGSVFKMVVAAGVLEENLLCEEELFNCMGTYVFADGTGINCLQEHGEVSFKEAIVKSCNTTFVQLGLRLGKSKFAQYAAKLGFTININNQSPPALIGNASIGQQGVLVSPLQIANLYATIGRNGIYRPCRIVAQIRNYQGDVIQEFPGKIGTQVLKASTCAVLKDSLSAATRIGTGRQAWIEGRGTAGKTGTAQANKAGKVIAWFAGFTPLENPRLAIAVMVEEKKLGSSKGIRGGEEAAPLFKKIAEEIFELDDYSN